MKNMRFMPIGLVFLFAAGLSLVYSTSAQPSILPFDPPCNTTVQGNDGSPLSEPLPPFKESFDPDDRQKYCYVNETLLYIQQDVQFTHRLDIYGNPIDVRPSITHPDMYINNLSFAHSKAIGHPQDPLIIQFRYYRPKIPVPSVWRPLLGGITEGCFEDKLSYFSFLGNDDTESFSEQDFNSANYQLNVTEMACNSWMQFSHTSRDYVNEFGSSFSHNRKELGAVDLEMAHVYVDLNSLELCSDAGCTKVMQ